MDGRNPYKPHAMLEHGFTYVSVGREAIYHAQESNRRSG
jgi:hypothetical protein